MTAKPAFGNACAGFLFKTEWPFNMHNLHFWISPQRLKINFPMDLPWGPAGGYTEILTDPRRKEKANGFFKPGSTQPGDNG